MTLNEADFRKLVSVARLAKAGTLSNDAQRHIMRALEQQKSSARVLRLARRVLSGKTKVTGVDANAMRLILAAA